MYRRGQPPPLFPPPPSVEKEKEDAIVPYTEPPVAEYTEEIDEDLLQISDSQEPPWKITEYLSNIMTTIKLEFAKACKSDTYPIDLAYSNVMHNRVKIQRARQAAREEYYKFAEELEAAEKVRGRLHETMIRITLRVYNAFDQRNKQLRITQPFTPAILHQNLQLQERQIFDNHIAYQSKIESNMRLCEKANSLVADLNALLDDNQRDMECVQQAGLYGKVTPKLEDINRIDTSTFVENLILKMDQYNMCKNELFDKAQVNRDDQARAMEETRAEVETKSNDAILEIFKELQIPVEKKPPVLAAPPTRFMPQQQPAPQALPRPKYAEYYMG